MKEIFELLKLSLASVIILSELSAQTETVKSDRDSTLPFVSSIHQSSSVRRTFLIAFKASSLVERKYQDISDLVMTAITGLAFSIYLDANGIPLTF